MKNYENRKIKMLVTKLPSDFTLTLCKAGYLFLFFFSLILETSHMQKTSPNY